MGSKQDLESGAHRPTEIRVNRDDKSIVEQFVSSSTLHGLRFVFEKRRGRYLRLLWLLVVLIMIGMFIWQASLLVSSYFQFKVTSKVQISYYRRITFPAITICNENMYRNSAISNTNFEKALKRVNPLYGDPKNITWHTLGKLGQANMTEYVRSAAHTMNYNEATKAGMLYLCQWQGKRCSVQNFTEVLTEMGLCYTFNSGKDNPPLVVESTGVKYSLKLILSVEQEDYVGFMTHSAGLRILVHDQKEPPLVKNYGFAVAPGSHVYASISKNRVISLPKPYETMCENRRLSSTDSYSKAACYKSCKERYIVSQCHCRAFYMSGETSYPYCDIYSHFECVSKATEIFDESAIEYCGCTEPCDTTFYRMYLSYGQFPSVDAAKQYANNDKNEEERFKNNLLAMDVYFERLDLHTIEQVPIYDSGSLFGEVGGLLGLFLGASFITLFEIVDFILQFTLSQVGGRV